MSAIKQPPEGYIPPKLTFGLELELGWACPREKFDEWVENYYYPANEKGENEEGENEGGEYEVGENEEVENDERFQQVANGHDEESTEKRDSNHSFRTDSSAFQNEVLRNDLLWYLEEE